MHCDCSVTLFTNCTLTRKQALHIEKKTLHKENIEKRQIVVSQHPIPTIDKLDDGFFFTEGGELIILLCQ